MSIHVKSYNLSAFGADRAKMLYDEGTIAHVRCPLWPEEPAALANRQEWAEFRAKGVPLWGWINCSPDQTGDVVAMRALDAELQPEGWVLDIEKPLEHADLSVLCKGARSLGKPLIASLSGANPNHNLYDHRTLDRYGIVQEWQAYSDSGEGPRPLTAVKELFKPSRVFVGAQYRSRILDRYGWGQVTRCAFSTGWYHRPGTNEREFKVASQEWGWNVLDRRFVGGSGLLLGLAPYSRIRVCILADVIAADHGIARTPAEWTAYAASARAPGMARRGVSVFPVERASDEMLRAVAGESA